MARYHCGRHGTGSSCSARLAHCLTEPRGASDRWRAYSAFEVGWVPFLIRHLIAKC